MSYWVKQWWKFIGAAFIFYSILIGFYSPVPELPILHESIRNLYFHVPMWFGMTLLLLSSAVYSIAHLSSRNLKHDFMASSLARIAMLFGLLGLLTGMQWARTTWGAYWTNDPKLNGAAIGMLLYLAYFVLRNSFNDDEKRARVSSVYNIMAFAIFIPAIYIVPRMTDSLHPGNGGNPGFDTYDLDGDMRLVFYPAVIGWFLLGLWMAQLSARIKSAAWRINELNKSQS